MKLTKHKHQRPADTLVGMQHVALRDFFTLWSECRGELAIPHRAALPLSKLMNFADRLVMFTFGDDTRPVLGFTGVDVFNFHPSDSVGFPLEKVCPPAFTEAYRQAAHACMAKPSGLLILQEYVSADGIIYGASTLHLPVSDEPGRRARRMYAVICRDQQWPDWLDGGAFTAGTSTFVCRPIDIGRGVPFPEKSYSA